VTTRFPGLICGPLMLAGLVMASMEKDAARELQFEVIGREVEFIMTDADREAGDSGPLPVLVIKADEQWRRWAAGATVKYSGVALSTSKKPDFANQMAIAVGTFHAGGITGQGRSRAVVVSRILETEDRLVVHVTDGEERIGGGCIGQYFFHVVKLPKSHKRILLIKENAKLD
jgi:hypothetical protein